jgi:hypothetical protein
MRNKKGTIIQSIIKLIVDETDSWVFSHYMGDIKNFGVTKVFKVFFPTLF